MCQARAGARTVYLKGTVQYNRLVQTSSEQTRLSCTAWGDAALLAPGLRVVTSRHGFTLLYIVWQSINECSFIQSRQAPPLQLG